MCSEGKPGSNATANWTRGGPWDARCPRTDTAVLLDAERLWRSYTVSNQEGRKCKYIAHTSSSSISTNSKRASWREEGRQEGRRSEGRRRAGRRDKREGRSVKLISQQLAGKLPEQFLMSIPIAPAMQRTSDEAVQKAVQVVAIGSQGHRRCKNPLLGSGF